MQNNAKIWHEGYVAGQRSMDAKHYAVVLRLQDLEFDGGSHENLSKIAYAIYPCATGWTCESSEGLRDELVRLLGGVGKPSGGFAKSADFGKSESVGNDEVGKGFQIHQTTTMYDVLGNERHKAVCELRKVCTELDESVWTWIEDVAIAIGAQDKQSDEYESMLPKITCRLIHLLGGDECNFSGVESYRDAMGEKSNPAETSDASTDHVTLVTHSPEDETCPNDDRTCLNPVQCASITDELGNERQKAVAELRKLDAEDGKAYICSTEIAHAIGLDYGETFLGRLIHLLGGDEPTAMEYIQRIVREHDGRCLDMELSGAELSQASVDAMSRRANQSHESSLMTPENETGITDELRECVNTATKAYDDTLWYELGDDSEADHTICHITEGELLRIADRMDEQFARVCEQQEAVLQQTIDELTETKQHVKSLEWVRDRRLPRIEAERDKLQAKLEEYERRDTPEDIVRDIRLGKVTDSEAIKRIGALDG